jgi:hypothetical protein
MYSGHANYAANNVLYRWDPRAHSGLPAVFEWIHLLDRLWRLRFLERITHRALRQDDVPIGVGERRERQQSRRSEICTEGIAHRAECHQNAGLHMVLDTVVVEMKDGSRKDASRWIFESFTFGQSLQ